MVPSTAKRSTPDTEFVLRNAEGKRAYLQVKSGVTQVPRVIEVPQGVDVFFVFDPTGDAHHRSPKVVRIDNARVKAFAISHPSLLPKHLFRSLGPPVVTE